MRNKELASCNRPHKRQQAIFLPDLSTAKGDKIDRLLLSDWQETQEGRLDRNRSTIIFGSEMPTKGDWMQWRMELSKIHTPTLALLTPLDKWKHPSARVWRYYFDENKGEIQARSEEGTEVYTRMDGRCRRYSLSHTVEGTAITGQSATIVELEGER